MSTPPTTTYRIANTPNQNVRAIFAGQDSFLDRPKWRKVFQTVSFEQSLAAAPGPITTRPDTHLLTMLWVDAFMALQTQLPTVVRLGYDLRARRALGHRPHPNELTHLRTKAAALHTALRTWYASSPIPIEPTEVPPADPTSPFTTVLRHVSRWKGGVVMSYWACVLILQSCLNQCHEVPLFTDNVDIARKILRSLEHVGSGLMGPHRVGMPLRVAKEFVDERTQRWTVSMVTSYSDTYAAMSTDVYPANPALDHSAVE